MPVATHRLRVGMEAQSELGFTIWTYCTNDPLEEVLEPNYFAGVFRNLTLGDLMFVGIAPRQANSPWHNKAGEVRRALLMITQVEQGKPVLTRLVHDYGRPEDPPLTIDAVPQPRPRGRPRKDASTAE